MVVFYDDSRTRIPKYSESEAVVITAAAQCHDARTAIGVRADFLAQVADVHVEAAVV
ncbi:hypothetical protein D3C86_2203210 [compost metagenome]